MVSSKFALLPDHDDIANSEYSRHSFNSPFFLVLFRSRNYYQLIPASTSSSPYTPTT